jgi:hypothetical protein
MYKAILIGNDDLVNTLHSLNLYAYVGVETQIAKEEEWAAQLFMKNSTPEMVIFGLSEDNASWVLPLFDKVKNKHKTQKIFYNLDGSDTVNSLIPLEQVYIENKFDIKAIVRSTAKLLKVTAREMNEKDVGEYFPIPVALLEWSQKAEWDLYSYENEMHMLLIKQGEELKSTFDKLRNDGIAQIYVPSSERLRCINSISTKAVLHVSGATQAEEMKVTEVSFNSLVSNFTDNKEANEEIVNVAKKCVENIKDTISKSGDLKSLLEFMLNNKSGYLFGHSVMTSYVANHILKQLTWSNIDQEQKMEMACFFHDMFLVPIYHKYPDIYDEEGLLYNDKLDEKDRELVAIHAKVAALKVAALPHMPMGIDQIIMQHHGFKNGEGINIGPSDEISPLSKVLQVAEGFVSRYMEVNRYGQKFDKKRQIEFLREQYHKKSYQPFIDALDSL